MKADGNTSIQIAKEVWKELSLLKIKENLSDFNEVIKFLLTERRKYNKWLLEKENQNLKDRT